MRRQVTANHVQRDGQMTVRRSPCEFYGHLITVLAWWFEWGRVYMNRRALVPKRVRPKVGLRRDGPHAQLRDSVSEFHAWEPTV
jgi:hypothetical protein